MLAAKRLIPPQTGPSGPKQAAVWIGLRSAQLRVLETLWKILKRETILLNLSFSGLEKKKQVKGNNSQDWTYKQTFI